MTYGSEKLAEDRLPELAKMLSSKPVQSKCDANGSESGGNVNPEQWKRENDEFESRSRRLANVPSSNVNIQIRKGKKVLAGGAQALSETEGKPPVKAMAYTSTLHIRPSGEMIEGSEYIPTTVARRE